VTRADPQRRFRDDGRSHFSYLDGIVVTCPKCAAAGHVVPFGVARAHPDIPVFAPRRFLCSGCNHRAESRGGTLTFGTDGRDPYLRLPLRLQARTRHGMLYAYNAAHLDWIEAFVAAPLRERRIAAGRANRSIASRLPAWVKAAKNRADVLRALARMRRGLADPARV
jgi:hypothetical protein